MKAIYSAQPTTDRWDKRDYHRIERVRYNEDEALLTVEFADGTTVTFNPEALVPSNLAEIDWWRTASNEIEVIVPHQSGWFEIPWDVVRRHTDPEYVEHWERICAAHRAAYESASGAVREEPPEFG